MSQFQNVETSVLFDMLALHTQQLTELFTSNKLDKEYHDCKKVIEEIQLEISKRNHLPENTDTTGENIQFGESDTG